MFKPKNITVTTAVSRRKDNRIRISSCRPFLLVYILIGCNLIIYIHCEVSFSDLLDLFFFKFLQVLRASGVILASEQFYETAGWSLG
jgi:hypothetical protein